MQFFRCKLIVPIGQFTIGHEFEIISIDYENGRMKFWGQEGQEVLAEFQLALRVTTQYK